MRKLLAICLGTILFSSCMMEHIGEQIISIDINSCISAGGVSIYDICDKVELIPLDDSVPISNTVYDGIANITTDGQKIYLMDSRRYIINAYSLDGSLLISTHHVGRGPGEYTMASQIQYNSRLDLVEVLNPMGKILRYSCDSLKYVSELNLVGGPYAIHYFSSVDDNYILYSHTNEEQLYLIPQNSFTSLSLGLDPPMYLRNYMSASSGIFMLYGRPCVFRPYDGLVLSIDIDGKCVKPLIEWDMGEYNCMLRDIPQYDNAREYGNFIMNYSQNHIAAFCSVNATDEWLFATVIFKGEIYTLSYNLMDKTYKFFNRTKEGMRFLPELFHDNIMYKYVESTSLSDFVNRDVLDLESRKQYDAIMEHDGLAIIKYTLK